MIKRFLSIILFAVFIFNGCSAKVPTEVESTIKKVANIYDEQKPQMKKIIPTEDQVTKETIYLVSLEGNFQKGEQKSSKLEFTVTKDGAKVVALTSDSWHENEVNIKN